MLRVCIGCFEPRLESRSSVRFVLNLNAIQAGRFFSRFASFVLFVPNSLAPHQDYLNYSNRLNRLDRSLLL